MLDITKNLCYHLEQTAKSDGGLYILNEKGEETYYSYCDVYKHALRRLKTLNDKGIKTGDELLIVCDDIMEFLSSLWGCVLGGIIAIPLNIGTTKEDMVRLQNLFGVLENPYLFTDKNKRDAILDYVENNNLKGMKDLIEEKTLVIGEFKDSKEEGRVCDMDLDSIALIQFSSGSTGTPKGVIITHRNWVSSTKDITKASGLDETDSFLSWLPLTHNMGLLGLHTVPFLNGINQVLIPPIAYMKRPEIWLDAVSKYRITSTTSPNFGFRLFVNSYDKMNSKDWDLSCVRRIYNGAEPVSMELCRQFYEKVKQNKMKFSAIYPVYGLAEATLAAAFPKPFTDPEGIIVDRRKLNIGDTVKKIDDLNDKNAIEFAVVGYNLDNCEICICDENNNKLEEGRVGLINIKGRNICSGYYKSSLKIAREDGWYNTGDLGFIVDGKLSISGRHKEIIIVNGQNYYPFDIERVCSCVDGVVEGTVVACGSYNKTTNKEDLIIFIKTEVEGEKLKKIYNGLRKELLDKLLIPIDQIIKIDDIPKTTSSKVARFKLVEMYENGYFDDQVIKNNLNESLKGIDENLTKIQKDILNVFKDELNLYEIGMDDELLTLGLDSMNIVKLANVLSGKYPNKISIADMYKFQSIREISTYIESQSKISLNGIKLKEDYICEDSEFCREEVEIDTETITVFKNVAKEKECKLEDVIIGVCLFVISKMNDVLKFNVEVMNDTENVKEIELDFTEINDLYSIATLFAGQYKKANVYKLADIEVLKNDKQQLLLFYDYKQNSEKTENLKKFEIAIGLENKGNFVKVHINNNENINNQFIKALFQSIESVLNQIKSLVHN